MGGQGGPPGAESRDTHFRDRCPVPVSYTHLLAGGRDICVVGDPRQAIYGWKGAEPSYLTGFTVRYPDSKVFDLTRNYRSTPQILGWANRVATAGRVKALVATRPRGSQPRVTQLDDDQVEAAWVAKEVRRALRAGTPTSEIAVLYRFNATQARFEAAFAQAGICLLYTSRCV